MTICIQCALEAYVAGKTPEEVAAASRFDEEPEAHRLRLHPDLKATRIRRQWLDEQAARRMGGSLITPKCPNCGHDDALAISQEIGGVVQVRCTQCGHEFPTTTPRASKQ